MGGLPRVFQEAPRLCGLPCWLMPIFAGCAWSTTLTGLLFAWIIQGSPHYDVMSLNQHYAYISDIGTTGWGKPAFVAGASVTVFLFSLTFAVERYLQCTGDLSHMQDRCNPILGALAAFFTAAGGTGLILLTIFDAQRHINVHFPMIGVFVGGYFIAAVCAMLEKKRISASFPQSNMLQHSWRTKLFFIVVEGTCAAVFGSTFLAADYGTRNASVLAEWVVAFLLVLYMWSCALDFLLVPQDAEGRTRGGAAGMVPLANEGSGRNSFVSEVKQWSTRGRTMRGMDKTGSWMGANEKTMIDRGVPMAMYRSTQNSRKSPRTISMRTLEVEHFQDDLRGTRHFVRLD